LNEIRINFRADGLGMKIHETMPIISYCREKTDLPIVCHWPINKQCSCHYLDLFKNSLNIKFEESPVSQNAYFRSHEFSNNLKAIGFSHKEFSFLNKNNKLIKKALTPTDEIKSQSLKLLEEYNITPETVGISLRVMEGFLFENYIGDDVLKKDLNKAMNIPDKYGFILSNKSKYPSYEQDKINEIKSQSLKSLEKYDIKLNPSRLFDIRDHFHNKLALIDSIHTIENSKNLLKDKRVLFTCDSKLLEDLMLSKYKNFFSIKDKFTPQHCGRVGSPDFSRSPESIKWALSKAYILASIDYQNTIKLPIISAYSRLPQYLPNLYLENIMS
jgi:hypothetical protein